MPAAFGQESQRAGRDIVWPPNPQPSVMLANEAGQQLRVDGVILGAARGEGFAVLGELLRIEREQHETVVLHQGIDQRSARLLEADGDRPAIETLPQSGDPFVERDGVLRHCRVFDHTVVREQADGVLRIGPIDADEDCVRMRVHW
jgi:hypothetical protein